MCKFRMCAKMPSTLRQVRWRNASKDAKTSAENTARRSGPSESKLKAYYAKIFKLFGDMVRAKLCMLKHALEFVSM
jgi:hypothetical protein